MEWIMTRARRSHWPVGAWGWCRVGVRRCCVPAVRGPRRCIASWSTAVQPEPPRSPHVPSSAAQHRPARRFRRRAAGSARSTAGGLCRDRSTGEHDATGGLVGPRDRHRPPADPGGPLPAPVRSSSRTRSCTTMRSCTTGTSPTSVDCWTPPARGISESCTIHIDAQRFLHNGLLSTFLMHLFESIANSPKPTYPDFVHTFDISMGGDDDEHCTCRLTVLTHP